MIITESVLRKRLLEGKSRTVTIGPGDIVTPAARDFLNQHAFHITVRENRVPENKPEHMTHLNGAFCVLKTHPRIALRGKSDSFQAKILEAQLVARGEGWLQVVEDLGEVLSYTRELLACEVRESPFEAPELLGMNEARLREVSHNPQEYFGVSHTPPGWEMGGTAVAVNALRAESREVELAAVRAFTDESGSPERMDILRAFNRLSSALYIIFCRLVGGWYGRNRDGD